jgi:cyclopropane-fatty-acyl-phospholipid synthase
MNLSKTLFLKSLKNIKQGSLEVISGGESWQFGDAASSLRASLFIHDERFFRRAVLGGDVAIGESWMDGEWTSPDLVSVVRLAVRNLPAVENQNRLLNLFARGMDRLRHLARDNSIAGSRKNISAHYDLSNDFFQLFLDPSMMYSCAYYESESDSLETAQFQKLDRICRKLRLGPKDHVLEIGTGWGAFALHATKHYGCRVTTTTISREQYDVAERRFAGTEIDLLFEDYRHLKGQFDKIVSIEMFEAVGLKHYDEFFGACDRLLKPDGSLLMQTITMNERSFPEYRHKADWIQKYIFPGSELASVSEILRSLARCTSLSLYHFEDIGTHYARTLAAWRDAFKAHLDQVRGLGFDERFLRMWDYYLAYCEGAFLERHIGDAQILMTKARNPHPMFGEPWGSPEATYHDSTLHT